jgi:transcriptional regulator with XRE-family HTH domain
MRTREFAIRHGEDLGRTIAEARAERGLTQEQLATRTGIERTYLARLEAGHVVQQVERALTLLRTLGVTITARLDGDDA